MPWFNCHVCWSFSGNSLSWGWRYKHWSCLGAETHHLVMLWQVSQHRFPLRINAFISYGAGTGGVVVDCHASTFHLEEMYLLRFWRGGCQQLPQSVRLLFANIDWAVSDFLADCAPLHRQPHLSALLLSCLYALAHCSRSGLWPRRDFLTAYACAHRAETFVWKT